MVMNYHKMKRIRKKPTTCLCILISYIVAGILLYGPIQKSYNKKLRNLDKYILIYSTDRMQDLRNGMFMAEGKIIAVDPKSIIGTEDQYMEICKVLEEYRLHTEVKTVLDDEGNSHTEVEEYRSWDEIEREIIISNEVKFLDRVFKIEDIKFNHNPRRNFEQRISSNRKLVYYTFPKETESGILTGIMENGVGKDLVFKKGRTILDERNKLIKKLKNNPKIILSLWFILWTIVLVAIWEEWKED